MPPIIYPPAIQRPSTILHERRAATWGVTMHWTAGHEAGDTATLDGPKVDCHVYFAKDGDVYQFVPLDRTTYHGYRTANRRCISVETEGFGEPWTTKQFDAIVEFAAWVSYHWAIPLVRVDPVRGYSDNVTKTQPDWNGFFGHVDLAGIDGNNHTDTVPPRTGWGPFLNSARKLYLERYTSASPYVLPWSAYVGTTRVGRGSLLAPAFVKRVVAPLRAAGGAPPWIAYVGGREIGRGVLWRPSTFTKAISGALRTGKDVTLGFEGSAKDIVRLTKDLT